MSDGRLKLVVVVVLALAVAMIFVEDLLFFLGATDGDSGVLGSPYVTVAIPLTIALLLLAILVGGAILYP